MTKNRTIPYEQHYVQVGFYQNLLEQENEVLKAKLEVEHSNNLMRL